MSRASIPGRRLLPALAALAALGALPAATASAQTLELRGRGDLATDSILRRVTGSGAFRLITADTVFPASDTIRGPVVIAATTVKLENVIIGEVVIVDANVFMRPHSRISGDVTNIAGGLFRAETARIDGAVREWKDAPYRAERRDGGARITGTRVASLIDLDGLGGLHAPTYDRVAGLTAAVGARYLMPRAGGTEPEVHAWVGYQTARERLVGGGEVAVRQGALRVALGAERVVLTNDAWARGWTNAISYLSRGHDYRDYYAADRYRAGPSLTFATTNRSVTLRLTGQIEEASSLASLEPWHATGDSVRPNPPIDDGRITSARLALEADWERPTFFSSLDLAVEAAGRSFGGEHAFARFDLGGVWAMQALADHSFTLTWRFRGPLPGTDSLPRQRWGIVGGRPTLHTLEDGARRGDRLAFIESEYAIPFPLWADVPVLGRPSLELIHRIGSAWTLHGDADLVQNLGVRLRTRFVFALAITDPDEGGALYQVGFSIRRRHPWSPGN